MFFFFENETETSHEKSLKNLEKYKYFFEYIHHIVLVDGAYP